MKNTVAILVCFGSALVGVAFGTWEARRDAVRAGVAYYSVNPTNGAVQFRYRVCIDPEEIVRKLQWSVSPVLPVYPVVTNFPVMPGYHGPILTNYP